MNRLILVCLLIFPAAVFANDPSDSASAQLLQIINHIDSVNKALRWQHSGTVELPGAGASLRIPDGFKFLNAEQSQYLLTDLWGNPEDHSVLGMVFPEESGILGDSAWAYVVTYQAIGHVKDEDADKIDYDELMKQMKEDDRKDNEERKKLDLPTLEVVGWAQKPYYDKLNHVLHWARELKTEEGEENTLNYDIRMLGRKGVLSMNAVASMSMLPVVRQNIDTVMNMASFSDGNRYTDFDSNTDEIAAWTIGGLVAGKVLAKAGLFAVIGKFLVAAWKFILVGLVAIGGFVKKLFFRRKDEEVAYEPVQAPDEGAPIE